MKPRAESCGCKSTDATWTHLCDQHRREFDDTHQRWHREYVSNQAGAGSANPKWIAEMTRIETEDA